MKKRKKEKEKEKEKEKHETKKNEKNKETIETYIDVHKQIARFSRFGLLALARHANGLARVDAGRHLH